MSINAYLPILNLSNYHAESKDHIYKLKITPDTKLDKNGILINHYRYHYNQILESITKYGTRYDAEICQALDNHISQNNPHLPSLSDYNISFADLQFSSLDLMAQHPDEIQPRIDAIFKFNKSFLNVIKYVISERNAINRISTNNPKSKTLTQLFMECKHMVLKSIRNSYIRTKADNMPVSNYRPKIQIDRLLIKHKRDKGKIDDRAEWTTFACVMNTMKKDNYEGLRMINSFYKAYEAIF